MQPCILYLPDSSGLEHAQNELANVAGIRAADQLWFYDKTDVLTGSCGVTRLPPTTPDDPIIVWAKPEWLQVNRPEPDLFLEAPVFNANSNNLPNDVIWSREVSAQVIQYSRHLKNLLKCQHSFTLIRETLCELSRNTFKKYQTMFSEAVDTFSSLQLSGKMLFGEMPEQSASKNFTPFSSDQVMIGKLVRLEKHIKYQFKDFDEDSLFFVGKQTSDCILKRCESKLETYVDRAKTTYEQFKKDKERTLSYNEEQIHKYDKIKLNDALKKSIKLLKEHCLLHTLDQQQKLIDWHCKELKLCSDQLIHIEKDLKKFQAVYSDVFTSIEKNFQSTGSRNEMPSSPLSPGLGTTASGMQSTDLCPTSTKLPFEMFKLHLDFIQVLQDDNLHFQEEIENQLKENDEILNRIQAMFLDESSGQ